MSADPREAGSLTTHVSIDADAETVWNTLVAPALWWDGVTFAPKVGSRFREVWSEDGQLKTAFGIVLAVSALDRLTIRWKEKEWPGHMTFIFTVEEDETGTTNVIITEEGWEMFPPAKRRSLMGAHRHGWRYHLQDLKSAAEESLRQSRRQQT